jgi:hypothetical protein
MPNGQIETPKVVLSKQAEVPKVALGGTPIAALGEGVSGILSSIANALPEAPVAPTALPSFPKLPTGMGQMPQIPKVTEFIKGIEAGLPEALPKLSLAQGVTERGGITEGEKPTGSVATRGSL